MEGRGGDDRGRRNRNRDLGSYMNEGQSRGGRDRRGGEQRSYRRYVGVVCWVCGERGMGLWFFMRSVAVI